MMLDIQGINFKNLLSLKNTLSILSNNTVRDLTYDLLTSLIMKNSSNSIHANYRKNKINQIEENLFNCNL